MGTGADPVAVIGGGVGGLTTALALRHQGIDCAVYERAPELCEIGAGVGVWPAALRVFDRLGLGDSVRALSSPWESAGVRRHDGRFLIRYDAGQFAARLGEPTIGVHRGELQGLLLRTLPAQIVHTGHECTDIAQRDGTVTVTFADGTAVEARAVIAADGLRSAVRASVFGPRELHDCRYVGWRGTAPEPRGADWHEFAGETWGRDTRFGMIPIGGGRITWYATARRFQTGGGKDELLQRFGHWHHPIHDVVAATDASQIWRDHIFDLWPLRRWSWGRVTLLGDAAHPMTPELGQGACQAILDAWAVADALAAGDDPAAAFAVYERRRRPRAAAVAVLARAIAVGGNVGGRVTRTLRDNAMRVTPPSVMLRQLDLITRG
jgi:2-polyprenyl-6-methoxyphenol hydroxylase-like FAD-dependent oxidoreductase